MDGHRTIYAVRTAGRGVGIFNSLKQVQKILDESPSSSYKEFKDTEYYAANVWLNGVKRQLKFGNSMATWKTGKRGLEPSKSQAFGSVHRRKKVKLPRTVAHIPSLKFPVKQSAIDTAHAMDKAHGSGSSYIRWWDEAEVLGMNSIEYDEMIHTLCETEMQSGLRN